MTSLSGKESRSRAGVWNGMMANRLAVVCVAFFICASAAAQSGEQADLSIKILLPLMKGGGPTPAYVAHPDTFTVKFTNLGPADSSPLSFTDDLPDGTTFLALRQISGPGFACTAPGAGSGGSVDCSVDGSIDMAVFQIDVLVPASFPNWTVIHNDVRLHADDNNSLNNYDGPGTIVLADAVPSVGISGPATVAPGTSATYVMTMTNGGSSPTLTLSLWDYMQPGAQGSHVTLSNARQVNGPAFDCGVNVGNPLLYN